MMSTLFTATPADNGSTFKWPLVNLFRAFIRTRWEIRRITFQAEKERQELGFQRVPQRVWARRSALFIDR